MLQNGRLNLDVTWHWRTHANQRVYVNPRTRTRGHTHIAAGPSQAKYAERTLHQDMPHIVYILYNIYIIHSCERSVVSSNKYNII